MKNIVPSRDFPKHVEVTDIAMAEAGHKCADCDAIMRVEKGIELGHIFKLGTRYSVAMNANFTDEDGKEKPLIMGCYGIGVTRVLAAAVEQHHDDNGIIWPKELAPFDVHMMKLGKQSDEVDAAAESLYEELKAAGFAVLFDDRNESPGVKFNDADLIGIPVRLVVSAKTLKENAVEMKLRSQADRSMPAREGIADTVRQALAGLDA